MVNSPGCGERIWLRQPSKEFVVDRIARGETAAETFPKPAIYCHLLPFRRRKIATLVSTVSFPFLPLEGVPASLGPGLRTVSGAGRSLGAKLSPRASLSHDRRIRQRSEMLLAAAIAEGTAVEKEAEEPKDGQCNAASLRGSNRSRSCCPKLERHTSRKCNALCHGNPPAVMTDFVFAGAMAYGRWVGVDRRPPLTIGNAASYDRVKPFHTNVRSPIGANVDVSRAVPVHPGRIWIFLLWGLLCLLGGVNTSQAAGCHMQDRIVLGAMLSWENELVVDLSAQPFVQLPPVLAMPPCQGEVPRGVDFGSTYTVAALVRPIQIDSSGRSVLIAIQSRSEPIRPPLFRLDRPPRRNPSRAAVELRT